MESPFLITATVQPVSVAKWPPVAGTKCESAGWGLSHGEIQNPDIIESFQLILQSQSDCKSIFDELIYDKMVCAVGVAGENICKVSVVGNNFLYTCFIMSKLFSGR